MSFRQWEGEMGPAERYHRKLLYLIEVQAQQEVEDEVDREKWLESLGRPDLEEDQGIV
jgi:hypothetical protein